MLIQYTDNSALGQGPAKFKFPTLKLAKLAKGSPQKYQRPAPTYREIPNEKNRSPGSRLIVYTH